MKGRACQLRAALNKDCDVREAAGPADVLVLRMSVHQGACWESSSKFIQSRRVRLLSARLRRQGLFSVDNEK